MKSDQKRIAYSLCKDDGFECNSSSTLFAAILRRNQIPTRILCCRNDFGSYPTPPAGTMHMKVEFFQDNIGWIPVEASDAVGDKSDRNFGYDGMRLITVCFGPDAEIEYGKSIQTHQTCHGLRTFFTWKPGSNADWNAIKLEETWTVKKY